MEISSVCKNIGPASSIELNEMVYSLKESGVDPIILSYGEAPFIFKNLNFNNIDINQGAHYSSSMGILSLRERICNHLNQEYGAKLNPDNFMITAGSKLASYIALKAILETGDFIILHEPSWVSYQEHAKFCGANTEFLSYKIRVSEFENALVGKKFKAIILNNPHNPRGYLYTEEEIRLCANLCKKNNAYLIVDESYSDFVINEKFYSAANLLGKFDNIVVLNSVSKNLGLSGWRIGYLIADNLFLKAALKINQHLVTCAPTILQLYLADNFNTLAQECKDQMTYLMIKRRSVKAILDKYKLNYLSGNSTFYFFIEIPDKKINAKEFAFNFLKEEHVALIPGNAYGIDMKNFLRLSFGVESLERIEMGISLLCKKLKQGKSDEKNYE